MTTRRKVISSTAVFLTIGLAGCNTTDENGDTSDEASNDIDDTDDADTEYCTENMEDSISLESLSSMERYSVTVPEDGSYTINCSSESAQSFNVRVTENGTEVDSEKYRLSYSHEASVEEETDVVIHISNSGEISTVLSETDGTITFDDESRQVIETSGSGIGEVSITESSISESISIENSDGDTVISNVQAPMSVMLQQDGEYSVVYPYEVSGELQYSFEELESRTSLVSTEIVYDTVCDL